MALLLPPLPPPSDEEEEPAPRLGGQEARTHPSAYVETRTHPQDTRQHPSAYVSIRQRLLAGGSSSSPTRLLGGGSSQALSELAASLVFARTIRRLQNVTESAKRLGMSAGAPPGFAHALILVLRKILRCAPPGAFVRAHYGGAELRPRNAPEASASASASASMRANSNEELWFEEIRRALRFTLDAVEVALGQLGAKFNCFCKSTNTDRR